MTNKSKILLTSTGYFFNIVLFALIYWFFWLSNTSNFIINEQYNEQMIKPFFAYKDLPNNNIITERITNNRDAIDLIKPYYDTIKILNQYEKKIAESLYKYKILDSINHDRLMASYDNNFNIYLNKQIAPYKKIKDSIDITINYYRDLQKKTTNNDSKYFNYDVSIAKLNVKLSINEIELNKAKYNAYDKAIKSIPYFYNDTLYKISKLLYFKIDTLERIKGNILETIENKKDSIRHIAVDYYINRVVRLGFSDFLYFSIITASSTGYGDILPNNSIIRRLVSLEIILSLFLFGFFFYYIAKQKN